MPQYSASAEWADVDPLPQNDGLGQPLAAIMYSEAYSEAMSYFRAIIANQELSERVLALTEDIISMNPAHYTVWLYRAKAVFATGRNLRQELEWLNPIALQHLKNYQIWHHRQTLVDKLDNPDGEADLLSAMFDRDSKNYHAWSYRQWLVQRFGLWDIGELQAMDELLSKDIRNNSAWNHRWFLSFARNATALEDQVVVQRELEYAKEAIALAPQNQSPWNYIRGLVRKAKGPAAIPLPSLKKFAMGYATIDAPDDIRSSYALEMLSDIYTQEKQNDDAIKALDLLASRYDLIRSNYWAWRKEQLALVVTM